MKINKTLDQKKSTKDIFAFCFNTMLVVLELTALILLFTVPIEYFIGDQKILKIANWTTFKWFTTDSNIVMLVGGVIFMAFTILKWNGKIKEIPSSIQLIKLIMTSMLVLVLLVILGYTIMYPTVKIEMTVRGVYMGSNLLHHVICPVVAILTCLLFESSKQINIKKTLYILIPIVAYGIFYMVMAYTHQNPDGSFKEGYDWYAFCKMGGKIGTPFLAIALIGVSYLFTWLLWLINRKIKIAGLE